MMLVHQLSQSKLLLWKMVVSWINNIVSSFLQINRVCTCLLLKD